MDFAMAMAYIDEKNKLGSVLGLQNITELLRRLGNPQDKISCLHIAGTNGKGSVFSFVQEALMEAGFKVGRYISPTIFTYLERFQINKEYMSEQEFVELLSEVASVIRDMEQEGFKSPTSFEIETAISFLYFERRQVDYALIECGMGGSLDATNVIARPVETVFAEISMDHMQFLGNSIGEIAKEKSGIIMDNGITISAPQTKEAEMVLRQAATEKNNEFYMVDSENLKIYINEENEESVIGVKNAGMDKKTETIFFEYSGSFKISLLGEHQVRNAATAIEALRHLPEYKDGKITDEHIRNGLAKTTWLGRLTKVHDNPLMYVDGAHNEAAWIALKSAINNYFTNCKIIYIIGVLRDKEYHKMVDILADTMECAISITPNNSRGLAKEELAKVLRKKGVETVTATNREDALKKAFSYAENTENSMILVCGSLSFIAEYM